MAFPTDQALTGPASLLAMNLSIKNASHWLFYGGEGHISATRSCNLLSWKNINTTPWLQPRPDYFDRDGVETGPAPIQMFDGNYFMLYNAYTITLPQEESKLEIDLNKHEEISQITPKNFKHYAIGWVILDGKNPTKILQRSDKPLLSATYDYEIGEAPYTCTQYNSVYAKGMVKLEGMFFVL